MNWSEFYLICFVVGFGLSALSFLFGSVHLHLPHMHGGVHLGHAPHGHGGHSGSAPWFNLGTVAAFLAWFGGTGYLLMERSVWFGLALIISTVSGLGGASIVFLFLARFLMRHERALDSADYEMIGVLGRLSSPIRSGGTGELIYTQAGTRRVAGARAESGQPILKGVEVVVTRYEKGIAYVRPFAEMTGEMDTSVRS